MISCDCKDCTNRHIGCHGSCVQYAAYKERVAKANQRRNEIVAADVSEIEAKVRCMRRLTWERKPQH